MHYAVFRNILYAVLQNFIEEEVKAINNVFQAEVLSPLHPPI